MFAQVAVDIPSRALKECFDYKIPAELEKTALPGTTVLVKFGSRLVVGYVLSLSKDPGSDIDVKKIKDIESVLAPSAFDEIGAQCAQWMAQEYAASLSECVRLFLAPGQSIKTIRSEATGAWELQSKSTGPVDERWVYLSDKAADFRPRAHASRQRALLEALSAGAMPMAELSALLPGASSVINSLKKQGICCVEERRKLRQTPSVMLSSAHRARPEHLTQGQKSALAAINKALGRAQGDVVLVDGVTGSGKTEVYLSAIETCLEQAKGAIVLVPEISLTAQTVGRFRGRFGDKVAVLHSRLSLGERFDQWDRIARGEAQVVIGPRSALFAPLANCGIIVIDEEHEHSYKQDSSPRYHAREVASVMAKLCGAALVLGSATPSLEALARCSDTSLNLDSSWTRVCMPERPGQAQMPSIEVVDMKEAFAEGSRSPFSPQLTRALFEIKKRKEKAVLLLNRRGFASFLLCRECGCVPTCPHCSTSLSYHERGHRLMCHSCGRVWPAQAYPNPASRCPNCSSRYIAQCGLGTQQVEDELMMLLGEGVEIIRMDADSTRSKGAHQKLLEAFDASESAILIGTQMIAKGLDFPEVTLVGVINADTSLKMPDFRAPERTFDLLEQVAGRSGRGDKLGKVIIQSYWSSHPAIQAVAHHDRARFVEQDLKDRKEAYYPPYSRLSNIVLSSHYESKVKAALLQLADKLMAYAEAHSGWEVLGPAACLRHKLKDRYRWHLLVKSPLKSSPGPVILSMLESIKLDSSIRASIDVDAYDLL